MEKPKLTVTGLSWGVQSWCIIAMSALQYLPRPDLILWGDTRWEKEATYQFAARWTPWLEERGISVVRISAPIEVTNAILDPSHSTVYIPAYTLPVGGNKKGKLRKSCSDRFKIRPQRQYISAELGQLGLKKRPGVVEQWIGFSADEEDRIKPSPVKYISLRYPLIEMGMDRENVIWWLRGHGLEVPPRSCCIICPGHSEAEWAEIQSSSTDWQRAIAADEAIRHKRPGFHTFLWDKRQPLRQKED